MPKRPPWLDRVQFILFYAANPCDADFSIYVECAKDPVGELALFLLVPDPGEIVENFFQPKSLKTKRHGRKGRRGGKGERAFLPDVDDLIAEKLPGTEEMNLRPIGSGGRWVLHGINAYERIVWPLMLIDKVTDTLFDTMMGVIMLDTVTCPTIGRMLRQRWSDLTSGLFGWNSINLNDLRYTHNVTTPNGHVAGVGAGTFSVTLSMKVFNHETTDANIGIRIRSSGPSGPIADQDGIRAVPPATWVGFIANASIEGPATIGWDAIIEDGTMSMQDISILIIQIGN